MNVNDHHHHRGHSFNGIAISHENLHLFSNTPSSNVSGKLVRLSVESAKLARSGIDDLLSSTEGGKHDFDWLLTPPGTPDFPSSEGESQPTLAPPRSSLGRSTSNTNASSRISVSQSENNNHFRPTRSSSVTRSSISSSQQRPSSIPNKSSALVPSNNRPYSPITRSPSAIKPSTPSRSSTPSRVRSVPTISSADRSKPSQQGSRPSTPSSTSKPRIPPNLHSPSSRPFSRPSTPTRRHSMPSPSPATTSSTSARHVASFNGRNSAPISRPSSPGPRLRPVIPPDFPLDTPPNLRTTLPDRPVSAGRSRPVPSPVTLKANTETQALVTMSRRQSSPVVNRGRLSEYTGKSRGHINANEVVARKSVKASTTATDNNGFGRTISKKSLDMAIRHMDIRNSSGTVRSLSSASLFPQSIRTSTPKTQHSRGLSAPASVHINGRRNNGACFDVGNEINRTNGREKDERKHIGKLSEVDMYESCRYDALLLKEDLKNTNWLHSVDDKCDQGPIFDNGFESLPEPFGLL